MMMNFVIPALTSLQKDESYIADRVREKWFNLFASDTISTLQQGILLFLDSAIRSTLNMSPSLSDEVLSNHPCRSVSGVWWVCPSLDISETAY